jgi:hypothetical protein
VELKYYAQRLARGRLLVVVNKWNQLKPVLFQHLINISEMLLQLDKK